MTKGEANALLPGIYRIVWTCGNGESIAAVGVTKSGARWLAPINWIIPGKGDSVWKMVESAHSLMPSSK